MQPNAWDIYVLKFTIDQKQEDGPCRQIRVHKYPMHLVAFNEGNILSFILRSLNILCKKL
jgi:hypothetical protein